MKISCRTFFSNRTEHLLDELKGVLYAAPSTPFTRRLIVVPSPAMKSWLMLRLAQDPHLGIAAGLEITYLDQAVKCLQSSLYSQQEAHQFSNTDLALIIEAEIRQIVQEDNSSVWKPLLDYLKVSSHTLSKRAEKRLVGLSNTLAALFSQYGKYGGKMVAEWENTPQSEWQQELWNRIFKTRLSYPYRELCKTSSTPILKKDIQVNLFAISFLPPLYHNFFMQIANHVSVNYYLLSPCQVFWSDILSDRENASLQAYWKRRGAASGQQEVLEQFLRDRNPLLANLGKLGREMARQIENSAPQTKEIYSLKATACTIPQYEELHYSEISLEQDDSPFTLLDALQTDMLLMRNPDATAKIPINEDRSVQVHVAPTRMREMQILYNALLNIIDRHSHTNNPICPSDILVMIPDIESYIPFIKAVFESPDSALEAQITDLPLAAMNSTVRSFLHLLSLSCGRWDASSIKQLLDFPEFRKKQGFLSEDIRVIQEWVEDTNVRWGADPTHRDELLARDRNGRKMLDSSPVGTWEHAIGKLLQSLTFTSNHEVESTQACLLGRWIQLLRSLRCDLQWLHDGTKMTLSEWVHYLLCLFETYFSHNESDEDKTVKSAIAQLENCSMYIPEAMFPFSTIKHHLEQILQRSTRCYRENVLHAVRFCSMLPMRAIPARVVALAGLQEGAFPRQENQQSLNLLKGNPNADYCPSSVDYDRFLFLEAILSARDYFLVSYQKGNEECDHLPSLVISELLSYMDRAYEMEQRIPSEACVHTHPFLCYDQSYFSGSAFVPNYSKDDFLAAKAFYGLNKAAQNGFVVASTPQAISNSESIVDIRDLAAFAKNPLKTYLNKTLGIYLDRIEERQQKNDEDFNINALQKYDLNQKVLQRPPEQVWKEAEMEGKVPIGGFKNVAEETFIQESRDLQHYLSEIGIKSIFSISFSDRVDVPTQISEGHWVVPPLSIEHESGITKIVGELPYISSEGLLGMTKGSKNDIVKSWPQFLILHHAIQHYSLPIKPHLILLKEEKKKVREPFYEDPMPHLKSYLEHYIKSLQQPSMLLPELVPALVSAERKSLETALNNLIHDGFQRSYNDYAKWALHQGLDGEQLISQWHPTARNLFGDLYKAWYPRSFNKKQKIDEDI